MDPGGRPGELGQRLAKRLASPTRYEILSEVARGAMGRVLRVRDLELGRELAMKVLEPGEGGERMLAHFFEEARLTSQLGHPGIVSLYDVGVLPDGSIFYTMPLVEGQSLAEVLQLAREGRSGWSRTRVLHALLRACEALVFAHERGIVHRDLKPSNLMIGRHGEVLVMDWGLARHERHGRGGALGGTPATIAPDLLMGQSKVGPLADVYAFGAILYALCAGHLPYEDGGAAADFNRILRGPPTPLASLDPALPSDLIAITEKAMARDPRARYGSMQALREELQRFLEGRIVVAHPVGRLERVHKWVRRNPEVAVGLAASFVLLLALVLVQRESVQRVREEQRITQRKAHLANLAAVDAGLRSGEIGEAQRRLAAVQPEPGGFEWGHLRLQADSAERVLEVGGKVTDVAAAPGGELVAVASEERVVLWPLAQGAEPRELALGALVLCLAFSPDGSELALGLGDGSIARLDAHDLAERSRLHAHAQAVTRLAYSRSGASLASTSLLGNSLRVDRQAGEPLQASTALPSDIAFLDEGVLVLGSSEEPAVVRFLDARTLAEQRRIEAGPGRVEALAASSDGARFAVGLLDGRVLLFDATAEAPRAELEAHQGMIRGLAFDTSGELLASAGVDLSIGLWRAADGALIERRLGHTEHPSSIAFLEGAGAMISGASDGSARLWSVAGGAEVILRAPGGWVEALAFVQDRPLFFSLDWRPALCLWDAAKGEPVFTLDLEERANCLAASPREPRVAYAIEQSVVVFDHVRQREVQRFGLAPAHALSVAYGSKGQVLARTSAGELVELVPGAPPRRITEGLGGLNGAFALAPGDERAAVVAGAGRVLEVDLAGSAPPRAIEVPVDEVSALEFDLLGERLFVGSVGGDAFLLDAADGSELAALRGHDGRVTAAAFAPDGRIATGSADRTLRIWDGPDTLLVLRGHGDWVSDLGFDASGTCLASASRDGTLRLWRARPPALSPSR